MIFGKSIEGVRREFEERLRDLIVRYFRARRTGIDLNIAIKQLVADAVSDAYYEGLAAGGLEPTDWDADMAQEADQLIFDQWRFVDGLVHAIQTARKEKDLRDAVLTRVELWGNSINAAGQAGLNRANIMEMVEFTGDDGEESCSTCMKLKGQRHRRKWFVERGLVPAPGNTNFECQGFRCKHYLKPIRRR